MNFFKKRILRNKIITGILIFLASFTICFVVIIYSFRDIKYNQHLERVKSVNVVMSKVGADINNYFVTTWETLDKVSTRMELTGFKECDDIHHVLEMIYQEGKHEYCVLRAEDTIIIDRKGTKVPWQLYSEISNEKHTFILNELTTDNGKEKIMYFVNRFTRPISDGIHTFEYLVMKQNVDEVDSVFDVSIYGENCQSLIINLNGDCMYENVTDLELKNTPNVLSFFKNNIIKYNYNYSYENLITDINKRISDTISVTYKDEKYFLSYFSLSMEDWISVMIIPETNIIGENGGFVTIISRDVGIVFGIVLLSFSIIFLLMWQSTVKKQKLAIAAEIASNEAKTDFLSSMSHDIRTPMNAIMGMTEIALHHKDDEKQMYESLEKIKLSSNHLLTLINDILDISTIESGKMNLNIDEFSIIDAINTLINMIRQQANDKSIELKVHTHNFVQEYFIGDELRFNQVCINLLSNAVKYTKPNGKVLFDIWQEQLADENMLRIKCIIADTGIGMSKEFQEIMYDSFARGTDSKVDKISGSGLGLAIVKQMVTILKGTIECDSEVGKGTTFTFTVDLPKGRNDSVYELPKLNVLAIDEDRISIETLEDITSRLGLCLESINSFKKVNNSKEFANKINNCDMVFVHLNTPTNEGFEIVELIKSINSTKPVVLTDLSDLTKYSKEIEALGVSFVMNKPYFYVSVYKTIDMVIKKENSIHETFDEVVDLNMNVLVSEDNELNYEIVSELLSMYGVESTRAVNGQQCIEIMEKAEENSFDCILMDVRMPVMDGKEATRRLRKSKIKWINSIPIIAMTADAFAEDINSCLETGMNAHLAKPIDLKKLINVLEKVKQNDGDLYNHINESYEVNNKNNKK